MILELELELELDWDRNGYWYRNLFELMHDLPCLYELAQSEDAVYNCRHF